MQDNTKTLRFLFLLPRVLAIVFIGFLALFAMDVFTPGQTISYYIVALFMHLIPNVILLGMLLVAWKYESLGGLLFFLLGMIFTIYFKTYEMPISFLVVSFPVFLIGGLFLLHNYLLKTNRKEKCIS